MTYPQYGGAPTWEPKRRPEKLDFAKLIRDVLILRGVWRLYRSGQSPAQIAEVLKRQANVPLNQQFALYREAKAVTKGEPAGPLLQRYFGDMAGLSCPGCGHPVERTAKYCGECGRRLGPLTQGPSAPPKRVCPECHATPPIWSKFCLVCGHPIPPVPS